MRLSKGIQVSQQKEGRQQNVSIDVQIVEEETKLKSLRVWVTENGRYETDIRTRTNMEKQISLRVERYWSEKVK